MKDTKPPKILVFTGPSFSGKTTLLASTLQLPGFEKLITTTMRPKRLKETSGVDYWFRTPEDFFKMKDNGEFFEFEEVFPGKWYGSEYREIDRVVKNGYIPAVTLDVKGALKMISEERVDARIIYVQVLKETLLSRAEKMRQTGERGPEFLESLNQRIERLDDEIAAAEDFFFRVVNEDLDHAKMESQTLIHSWFPTFSRKLNQVG